MNEQVKLAVATLSNLRAAMSGQFEFPVSDVVDYLEQQGDEAGELKEQLISRYRHSDVLVLDSIDDIEQLAIQLCSPIVLDVQQVQNEAASTDLPVMDALQVPSHLNEIPPDYDFSPMEPHDDPTTAFEYDMGGGRDLRDHLPPVTSESLAAADHHEVGENRVQVGPVQRIIRLARQMQEEGAETIPLGKFKEMVSNPETSVPSNHPLLVILSDYESAPSSTDDTPVQLSDIINFERVILDRILPAKSADAISQANDSPKGKPAGSLQKDGSAATSKAPAVKNTTDNVDPGKKDPTAKELTPPPDDQPPAASDEGGFGARAGLGDVVLYLCKGAVALIRGAKKDVASSEDATISAGGNRKNAIKGWFDQRAAIKANNQLETAKMIRKCIVPLEYIEKSVDYLRKHISDPKLFTNRQDFIKRKCGELVTLLSELQRLHKSLTPDQRNMINEFRDRFKSASESILGMEKTQLSTKKALDGVNEALGNISRILTSLVARLTRAPGISR